MRKYWRQGDLLFVPIASLPQGARRSNGHIQEGEITGHVHRIAVLEAAEVIEFAQPLSIPESDCSAFVGIRVSAEGGVSILHEDHNPHGDKPEAVLPPGNYAVIRQREYSPEAIRNVAD